MLKQAALVILSAGLVMPASAAELKVKKAAHVQVSDASWSLSSPRWAPDGTRIAAATPDYNALLIYDLGRDSLFVLSEARGAGFGFSWSHDGKSLLARVSQYKGYRRLLAATIFDIETAQPRQLGAWQSSMPALPVWADADRAVLVPGRHGEILREDSGLSIPVILLGDATKPMYSFAYGSELKVFQSGQIIASRKLDGPGRLINARRSPDGQFVAFEKVGGNLFVMHLQSGDLTDLGRAHRPAWSPDSQHLVCVVSRDDGHAITASDLLVIAADGSQRWPLTETQSMLENNPDWGPDGTNIIFDDVLTGKIYRIDIEIK